MDNPPATPRDPDLSPAKIRIFNLLGVIGELYDKSGAQDFGLSREDFCAALNTAALKNLGPEASDNAACSFVAGLRLQELALALACAGGSEKAWETFLLRYREPIYEMAQAIAKQDALGRQLADNIFASLYGIDAAGSERVSKLRLYLGSGSLLGWLRALMAQEFINIYRRERQSVSLEEQGELSFLSAPAAEAAVLPDPRLEQATEEAIAGLPSEDRYILVSYFLDSRTLAEVARTLSLHESTLSRRLEKITSGLRKRIRAGLMRRGMSLAQADEALQTDVRDLQIDLRARLKENLQENAEESFSKGKRGSRGVSGSSY